MKGMIRLFFIVLTLIPVVARSDFALFESESTVPVLIRRLTATVVGTNQPSLANNMGSGFYLHHETNVYLITAKHVLLAEPQTNLLVDSVLLRSYSDENPSAPIEISIVASDLKSAGAFLYKTNRDVLAVRVASVVKNPN